MQAFFWGIRSREGLSGVVLTRLQPAPEFLYQVLEMNLPLQIALEFIGSVRQQQSAPLVRSAYVRLPCLDDDFLAAFDGAVRIRLNQQFREYG